MAANRRRFLALMALGVPATTSAMRQGSPSTILDNKSDREEPVMPLDLVSGVRERLWDVFCKDDVYMRVIRHAPSDCPPGKIRWAIEVEEPDGSSKSILDRHPRVLLVYGKSLRVLYGICLEQAGCRVESAPDNDAAMRLYREHGPYDIVLTDVPHFRDLLSRIRERNPEQAFAIVGACGATGIRFRHKIPILREGFRQEQLVRLVESAIKPRVRVLFVVGDPDDDRLSNLPWPKRRDYSRLWHFVTSHPESFEIELESDGDEALKRYRERGPYDMVLIEFRLPGLDGSDLALAIRRENPAQPITIIADLASIGPSIRQKLGDIPILKLKNLHKINARDLPKSGNSDYGAAQRFLARIEAAMALENRRRKASRRTEA
jgi:CheY-like chemotaxis protein